MQLSKRQQRAKAKRKAANVAKQGTPMPPGSKLRKKTENFPATLTMCNPGGVVSSAIRENARERWEKANGK